MSDLGELRTRFRGIVMDRELGSSEIARRMLVFIAEEFRRAGEEGGAGLLDMAIEEARRRTSMILPLNMLWVLREAGRLGGEGLEVLGGMAERLVALYQEALDELLTRAAGVLEGYRRIFTHSYSSTVIEALRRLDGVRVAICLGWPLLDGARAAKRLTSHGVEVTVYPDLGMLEALGRSEIAVVGCDAVLIDGGLVNRSGTRIAAELAGKLGIPLLSLCDSLKLDFQGEWRGEEEVAEVEGHRVLYQLFDVSEATLVSGYVSEDGLKSPGEFVSYARRRIFEYWVREICSVSGAW